MSSREAITIGDLIPSKAVCTMPIATAIGFVGDFEPVLNEDLVGDEGPVLYEVVDYDRI